MPVSHESTVAVVRATPDAVSFAVIEGEGEALDLDGAAAADVFSGSLRIPFLGKEKFRISLRTQCLLGPPAGIVLHRRCEQQTVQ